MYRAPGARGEGRELARARLSGKELRSVLPSPEVNRHPIRPTTILSPTDMLSSANEHPIHARARVDKTGVLRKQHPHQKAVRGVCLPYPPWTGSRIGPQPPPQPPLQKKQEDGSGRGCEQDPFSPLDPFAPPLSKSWALPVSRASFFSSS